MSDEPRLTVSLPRTLFRLPNNPAAKVSSPLERRRPKGGSIMRKTMGGSMMRKTIIALFALAAAGLVQPTVASARGGGGGGGHGGGGGGRGGGFGGGGGFHGGGGGGFHGGGFQGGGFHGGFGGRGLPRWWLSWTLRGGWVPRWKISRRISQACVCRAWLWLLLRRILSLRVQRRLLRRWWLLRRPSPRTYPLWLARSPDPSLRMKKDPPANRWVLLAARGH